MQDTRVSVINAGMVPGLIKCCYMSLYPTVFSGRRKLVIALSVLRNPPRSGRGVGSP
jgi:hypothetical protein